MGSSAAAGMARAVNVGAPRPGSTAAGPWVGKGGAKGSLVAMAQNGDSEAESDMSSSPSETAQGTTVPGIASMGADGGTSTPGVAAAASLAKPVDAEEAGTSVPTPAAQVATPAAATKPEAAEVIAKNEPAAAQGCIRAKSESPARAEAGEEPAWGSPSPSSERRWTEDRGCPPPSPSPEALRGSATELAPGCGNAKARLATLKDRLTQKWQGSSETLPMES